MSPPVTPTGSASWPLVACGEKMKSVCQRRVGLLVVGYVNDTPRFDQHLAEYQQFLATVRPLPPDAKP
jgi:hypothetical protein